MRPGSAASLPDSTTSTGLPCLSVGTRERRGRSGTAEDCMATTARVLNLVHDIYMQKLSKLHHEEVTYEHSSNV